MVIIIENSSHIISIAGYAAPWFGIWMPAKSLIMKLNWKVFAACKQLNCRFAISLQYYTIITNRHIYSTSL